MQTVKRKNLFSCGCCSCCCYFLICFDFFDFASAVAAKLISLIFLLIFCRFFYFLLLRYTWREDTHIYNIFLSADDCVWFLVLTVFFVSRFSYPKWNALAWSAIVYIFEGLAVGLFWFRWMMDSGFRGGFFLSRPIW